jgi:LPXTG-motif cell wall-anchored protein
MTKRIQLSCLILACTALVAAATAASAGGVAVGQSALIGNLDYSDTFTETAFGGEPGRTDNAYPVNSPGTKVENSYGHATEYWTNGDWSINTDSTVVSGGAYPIYPGGSGAGSATGLTQTGGGVDYGLAYGLRKNYVVQFDAVQTADRIDITSSNTNNSIADGGGLSVFFRAANSTSPYPKIGLYNPNVGEVSVASVSGIATVNSWNNYAVDFDQTDNFLMIYTNQNLVATVNLTTFDGGAFAPYEDYSNAFVSVGGTGSNILWSDNFQVGSAIVPEPSSIVALAGMSLLGLAGYVVRRRRG